jgi:membrane protein YdbS with pleckstrin-like domain
MPSPQLQAGERVLAEVRLSWLFILDSFGIFLATILTLGLAAYLRRRSTVLLITNRRLVLSRGVVDRSVVEMEMGRIAQVEVLSGLLDRMMGVGRLRIIALDQFSFEMYPVNGATELKDLIMSATGDAKRGTAPVVTSQAAVAAPGAGPSQQEILAAVEKLGRMRDSGVLTEAEFQAKKAELLRRL